jgi:hypothetical protein
MTAADIAATRNEGAGRRPRFTYPLLLPALAAALPPARSVPLSARELSRRPELAWWTVSSIRQGLRMLEARGLATCVVVLRRPAAGGGAVPTRLWWRP